MDIKDLSVGTKLLIKDNISVYAKGDLLEIARIDLKDRLPIHCHGLSFQGFMKRTENELNNLRISCPEGNFGLSFSDLSHAEIINNDWDL
jgi:hypothetical protein